MAFEAGKRSPSATNSHFTEVTYFNYVKQVNRIICLSLFLVKALLVAYKMKAHSFLTRNLKSTSSTIHSFPACLPHFPVFLPMWTSWKTRDGQVTPLEKPHQLRSFCLNSVHCWTWEHPFRKTVFKGTLYSRHATLSLPWLRCTRLLQRDYSHTAGTNHLSASTNNDMN